VSNRLVAARYAKALVQIGEERGSLDDLQGELASLDALVRATPDLERLCTYPLIAPATRAATFDAVLEGAGASRMVRQFFRIVAQAARLSLVHEIIAAFNGQVDRRRGILEAEVASAQELTAPQAQALTESLSKRTGKTIRLRSRVESGLLGGFRAQVGSTVYDASLQGQLRALKSRLLA